MKCLVVDAGLCNLGSIRRSLEICGADDVISNRPDNLSMADSVVLPGGGGFISRWHEACLMNMVGHKL
jgi:imidazoleglycerol phosphate synthase glutamine amidotransferase subunit HisH